MDNLDQPLRATLSARFGEDFHIDPSWHGKNELLRLAGHRTHRTYTEQPIEPTLLRAICACALSAPSKSDLQQADFLIVSDDNLRRNIAELLPDQPWVRSAPVFMVVLANGRRLMKISSMRGKPFPNKHLDQFFNCSVDGGILLATFIQAAEAVGLGCCPVSVLRDYVPQVSRLLGLPSQVIPIAGLCVGWPDRSNSISPRLPLSVSIHENKYDDSELASEIDKYDHRRHSVQPYKNQREEERWGHQEFYGWSEDKARQFGVPHGENFGKFVRDAGFSLE